MFNNNVIIKKIIRIGIFFLILSPLFLNNVNATSSDNNYSLDITLNPNKSLKMGEPVSINWEIANIPEGSSMGFFLEPYGSLSFKSFPVSGNMKGQFQWDTNSYVWAPTDAPEFKYGAIKSGDYVIEARIYNQPNVPLAGMPIPSKTPISIIFKKNSEPFSITNR